MAAATMLPVSTRRSPSASSLTAARRLARSAGRPAAVALALLVVVAGSCVLLHNRIADAEDDDEGLQVVTEYHHISSGSGGGHAPEAESGGGSGSEAVGSLFGDRRGVQLGSATRGDAASRPPSKFAQRLQEERQAAARAAGVAGDAGGSPTERAAQRAAARAAAGMAYPAQPEPAVEEWSAEELGRRRGAVRAAMQHAWAGYERYAWGRDELCPLTKSGKDSFGGLGATMVDALDTLHMMGLGEEYERAAEWVRTQMPVNASFDASVFESIIRVVGGTLAAYDLTGDKRMLERAQEVAHRLLPAYATPSGIPLNIVNLATMEAKNPAWNHKASTLAEFGTHQLEFWRLSQATGNATYTDLAEATIRHLHTHWPKTGLMPLFISPQTGNFTSRRVSLGALGDSYYEYLLKMWIVKGKGDEMYRQMWERAMDDMIEKLVMVSKDGLTYIAEYDRTIKHKFDHLVCFVPGMLALGAHSGAVQGQKAERYLQLAGELTNTCWQMYHRMPCGLSPEYVNFGPSGMRPGAAFNLLRPEALEAMWYMWRLTHDWRYRTWGWHIFQAFEKHCKVEAGYAGLKDVRLAEPKRDDTMQSFFLAETLKYLWLLFSEDDAFNMDEWVLNTEAHPLRASPPAREGQHAPGEATGKRWWWPPAKGGGSGGGGGGGLLAGGGGSDAGGATDGTAQQRR